MTDPQNVLALDKHIQTQVDRLMAHNEWSEIPPHTLYTLCSYIIAGVQTGDFLREVLSNNFVEAACRADSRNQRALVPIAKFVYNVVPVGAWGSAEKVAAWSGDGRWGVKA